MKKHYILLAAACALIACDPIEEDGTFDTIPVSSEALAEGFNIVQTDKNGNPAADGNYFKFTTNPARIVKVYNFKADGSENILAVGSSGEFSIAPSRGSNPDQVFYVCIYDAEGEKIETTKTVNVYVKQNLTVAEKLFCSDAGRKVYKWNDSKVFWGNMGYCGGDGSLVFSQQEGKWWGIGVNDTTTVSEDFETQLKHSVTGQLTGEEDLNAYFTMYENGDFVKFDANGNVLSSTTWSFDADKAVKNGGATWCSGRLITGENSVLWPFEINAGGKYVTEFEVVYIDDNHMTLVYPDEGAFDKLGGWGEATFWQFKAVEIK